MRALLTLSLAALAGCYGTPDPAASCTGEVHTETVRLKSDRDGAVSIPITLDANDDAFMVMVERASGLVSVDGVVDAAGELRLSWEDWLGARESLTNAFYASDGVAVLNFPVRQQDGPLAPGDWTVAASTLDDEGYPEPRKEVDVTVIRRSCVAQTPTLMVTIVYVGGLESDGEVTAAVETAAARWAEIYGAYGLAIDVGYAAFDTDGSVPEPILGGEEYRSIYAEIEEGLVLVVADDVGGFADLYGEAGGLPGPYLDSVHSAVAVSWLIHAGADASFSDDEVEVFAETMAHEAGHYLGLFHPVEMDWAAWDALGDTRRCSAEAACEDALGDNLMFPYPVCGESSCVEQSLLTDDQTGVLSLNVGFR